MEVQQVVAGGVVSDPVPGEVLVVEAGAAKPDRINDLVKVAIGVVVTIQMWRELQHGLRRLHRRVGGRVERYEHTEMRDLRLLELFDLFRRLGPR